MKPLPHIEIILPIYNEVQNVVPLMRELDQTIQALKSEATVSYLFINDGSTDGSRELLHRLNSHRDDVRVVDLIHNFGHSAAITCGVEHFEGDIAVIMDADMQDSPAALIDLFHEWKRGARTVVAERGQRQEKNKLLFRAFYYLYHKLATSMPAIDFGTHCLLDKTVVARLQKIKEKHRYFPGLVSYSSSEIRPVRINRQSRAHGESRVGAFGLLNLALTAFLSFSSRPVKMVSILGLVSATGALCLGMIIIGIKLFTDKAIPGWASLMTAFALSSGIQLLCLGMIGEYIARIYDEVKDRPLYLVESIKSRKTQRRSKDVA